MKGPGRNLSVSSAKIVKDLWILRHGQATHNPRAEKAKENGCSFEEFFDLMRQDDSMDSPLTDLGRRQASSVSQTYGKYYQNNIDLVVSSPLSRALETADLALPPDKGSNRVCFEGFREVNGVLMNARRRKASELNALFGHWDFASLTEQDESWTDHTLEGMSDCGERGYNEFFSLWMNRPEEKIFLVAHGGILRYTLAEHPKVVVEDGRSSRESDNPDRCVKARFSNCELRRYRFWCEDDKVFLREIEINS